MRQVAAAVHARTRSYVTVGAAAARWVRQWKGLGLDFYSVHYYDWMHPLADVDLYDSGCSALHTDAPVVVGEYPPGSATASFRQYLDQWLELKANDGFRQAALDYWIRGWPRAEKKPRWNLLDNVLIPAWRD